MVPYGQAGQYSGIYNSVNTIFTAFGPLIYSAIVQHTNNHHLAWLLTCLPPSCISLLTLVFFVDFEKGKADANRESGRKEAAKIQGENFEA